MFSVRNFSFSPSSARQNKTEQKRRSFEYYNQPLKPTKGISFEYISEKYLLWKLLFFFFTKTKTNKNNYVSVD